MLTLANQARNWRRNSFTDSQPLTAFRRWRQLHQQGRLRPVPQLPSNVLIEVEHLADRIAWQSAARRLAWWCVDAAAEASRNELVALFRPYALRRRAAMALSLLRAANANARWHAEIAEPVFRRLAWHRWRVAIGAAQQLVQ